MKDTIRILVDWKCNLSCPYCCNNQEMFRKEIVPMRLDNIDFTKYSNVCITGGEPLMFLDRVYRICDKLPIDKLMILYTNGTLLTERSASILRVWGIRALNIGLHDPRSFKRIIQNVNWVTRNLDFNIRFHIWNKFQEGLNFELQFPSVHFKYWSMNDCTLENEDRVILMPGE